MTEQATRNKVVNARFAMWEIAMLVNKNMAGECESSHGQIFLSGILPDFHDCEYGKYSFEQISSMTFSYIYFRLVSVFSVFFYNESSLIR